MNTITIGQRAGVPLQLDLSRLVDTRMLIQANSGGGKSWLLRLICERVAGKLQTIVLDPEGEFATLRERVDMALVGAGGELATDVRSASLLARKLCEVGISSVVDLYDLKLHDRREFVKRFIESLMSVKRELWHPLLIIIDEAHVFAPERSAGESVATDAVIALMSQGRKRGFAGILSTQRLSKLHKDAAAEANNVIIGRTWLDVDQQRAGDLLGMDKAGRQSLRDLDPGQFFSFGPAFNVHGVMRFQSDQVSTTHPKAGERHTMTAPKASEKIRDIVAQIGDLPKQAEEEARTIEDLRVENARLKRELAAKPQLAPATPIVQRVEVPVIPAEIITLSGELQAATKDATAALSGMQTATERLINALSQAAARQSVVHTTPADDSPRRVDPALAELRARNYQRVNDPRQSANVGGVGLPKAERAILTVLAQYPDGRSKRQVAILTGYAINGGGFNNAISALASKRYIERAGDQLVATEAGLQALGNWTPLPSGAALLAHWLNQLGKAERAILEVLAGAWPNAMTKTDIAAAAGYEVSGGGFNNAISRLRTLELIGGRIDLKASNELFD